ncbi:MAG: LacI family DNA-binding transcriptional regulator [Anaerolineae bacterium]
MSPKQNVTLKSIAEAVGVSTASVSRALNDQPGVSDAVRQQILETARRMGYVPDLSARSLAGAKTHTVAFVIPKTNLSAAADPFYPLIMEGVESHLSDYGYHVLLTTLDEEALDHPERLPVLNSNRIDGLILAGPQIPASFILRVVGMGFPVVLVDNALSQTSVNCVLSDDEGGAYTAARHLLEHGHRRILYLSGPSDWISNRERTRGYRRAMREWECEPLIFYAEETTIESGKRLLPQALEQWPDTTAVCAANDSMAIGAMRAAASLGRRVPQDLCVVGFDDISWAQMSDPPLTTIHVFKRRIGVLAAQRLLETIKSPDLPPIKTLVATKLIQRKTCSVLEEK